MNMHSFVDARQSVGYLESSGANLSQSLKRLSTGIKVEGAGDAGGLAVSSKLDSAIARSLALGANVQNGMSFLEAQDAAQTRLGGILTRMSELRQRYDDPIRNLGDGAKLNREFKHLQEEIRSLGQKKFNGISLFSNGSHQDSKLVIETDGASRPISGEITRNIFFESILANQNTGGAIGASVTTQGALGSFGATGITPAGGSTADQTVNGASGITPNQTVNATSGTTPDQTVNGTSGITPNQTVSGSAGTTPSQTVNGLQGTTPNQTVNGTAGGSAANQVINAPQGTTPVQTINAAQGTTVGLVSISAPAGSGGSGTSFNLTPASGTTAAALWTQTFAGGVNGFEKMSPVFDSNGDIFVGLNEHDEIRKLNAADGSTLQTYDLTDALSGTGNNKSWKVAVSSDTLYAANGDTKQLIAFDKATGVQKAGWPQTLGTAGYATAENPPFVHSNGNVYVASNGPGFSFINSGRIFGFAPDGSQLFSPINVDGQFEGGFAEAADGTLIATGKGGTFNHRSLIAFNPTTGAELWHKTAGNPSAFNPRGIGSSIIGPPAILGTSVVINDDEDETRAFDVATGNELWSIDIGHDMKGGPTVANVGGTDTVFVASSNGVVALRDSGTATPTTVWTSPVLDAENCTPVYDSNQNRVYVTDDNTGKVIALNAADGSQVWDLDIGTPGDASLASPAVDSNGNIYVGDNNGEFTAITPWEGPVADGIGSGFSTAPALSDVVLDPTAPNLGTLQVASVALNTGPAPPAGSLRITFTGRPTGPADIGVTVAGGGGGGGGTPPAVGPVGSGYQSGETPAARVIAEGIGAKTASLKTGLVTLIDGDTAPPAGPGSITDSSGSGNDGTVAAGQEPNHEVTDRRSGTGSYTFDGTNDKINLGTLNTQIGGQDKLTISAWVSHAATGDDRIVCKSPSTNIADHIFSLGIANDNTLRMRIGTDTTNATNMSGTTAIPNDGTWTHVAMTYDGTNVKSYVNGALDSTHTLSGNVKTSADNVYIGNVNGAQNRHFLGKLDDVGIWNRALTSTEIQEIAGPGNLTATASVNDGTDPLKPAGTLTVTPVGTTAIAGDFKVEVDNGTPYLTNLSSIGSGYDGGPPAEAAPTVTITGADVGTASGTATVNADGTLNVAFSGTPAGVGNLNVSVANGVARTPAGLTGVANPANLYDPAEAAPVVIINGADKGTLSGTATIQPDGNVNIAFSGTPTSSGPFTVALADGVDKAPANLTGIGSAYDPGESAPSVTITGANKGTLAGTATINANGTLDVAFSGLPTANTSSTELWNTGALTNQDVDTKPVIDSSGVTYFVASTNGGTTVNAVNSADGSTVWSIPLGTTAVCNPTLSADESTLFVGHNNGLRALNTTDGSQRWNYASGTVNTSQPALSNDGQTVYFGSADDDLHAVNTADGSGKWRFDTGANVESAAVVDAAGNIYVASTNRNVYKLQDNGGSATQLWVNNSSFSGGGSFGFNSGSSPALSNDGSALYLGDSNGNVAALDTATGTDNWGGTVQLPSRILGHIAVGPNDNVYVTSRSDGVYALQDNGASATELGSFQVGPNFSRQSPTVSASNQVFFTDSNGIVYSLDGADPASWGNSTNLSGVNWQANMGGGSQSTPVLDATGTIAYVGSNDNRLYAFTADPGDITVAVDNGAIRKPANLAGIGSGYTVGDPAPAVSFVGANKGTLAATSSINVDGTLNITFTGAPTDTANVTMNVANGPGGVASLTGIGSGYTVGDPVPTVTVTGANAGTLAGTASINANGTLDVTFTGNPTDSNNVTVQIADGVIRVGNLAGIGSGYVVGDPVPTVTVTGANAGTLAGTTSINANGTLDLAFTGSPTDKNNVTVQIADGVNRVANLTGIGSGYVVGDPAPAVTVTGANAGTLAATSSINANGTLDLTFTGSPTDKNNVSVQVADGVIRVANLTGIGSGYTVGDPAPAVTVTGANAGTLAATSSINANGTLDLTFTGNPTDKNNVTVQIADGLARVPNLTGVGSGYDPSEPPPAVTITGATKNTLAGTASINANGTLDIAFTGNPSDFTNLTVQAANGALRAPATLTGLGANQDPASPPAVTISGADKGTLAGTANVNPDGTVDVSFSGAPTGNGPLNVQFAGAGGGGASLISNQYLLDMNGDLWDYSVAEFESFTELVADARAQNGAEQNSLNTFWNLITTNANKLQAASGRIKDADYAKEMTKLSKNKILNQSAAIMLGKQNRITSEALLTIQRLNNTM